MIQMLRSLEERFPQIIAISHMSDVQGQFDNTMQMMENGSLYKLGLPKIPFYPSAYPSSLASRMASQSSCKSNRAISLLGRSMSPCSSMVLISRGLLAI